MTSYGPLPIPRSIKNIGTKNGFDLLKGMDTFQKYEINYIYFVIFCNNLV